MTFDLISGLHMQIQTWHPPLRLCTHAKYYVKSGLTNVLKNANKTKNMHLFSIRIANYYELKNLAYEMLGYFYDIFTGGKPRNYHEIVLTQICSQATSGTRRGSFQAENWIKKGWCHFHFCFILQLRTNNGEIRQ